MIMILILKWLFLFYALCNIYNYVAQFPLHQPCKSEDIKGYSMYKKKKTKNRLLKLLENVCIS